MSDTTRSGDNGSRLEHYLQQIDQLDDELDSLRGSYMADCKGPRQGIREVMDTVREAGENMKAFRVLLKGHREQRKQEKRIAALEQDDADAYEDLRVRLGEFADTPLGAAAVDRSEARQRQREESLDHRV